MHKNISVIIPFYNRQHYLIEAIESVFFQTVCGIELVLVDDGSRDSSLSAACRHWEDLCRRFPQEHERQLVSTNIPHSGRPGLVRNRGVQMAAHSLIAFLDSDDIWLPDKLERQLPLHERFRITHSRERWLRAIKSPTSSDSILFREVSQKTQTHCRQGNIFQDSLWKCIIGPSTVVMEKTLFADCGGFREDLEIAEDYEFWLRVSSQIELGYVDLPLIEKRAGMPGQNQLSERYGYIEIFRIRALKELLDRPECLNPSQQKAAWKVLKTKAEIVQKGAAKRGQSTKEMTQLIQHCKEVINAYTV